MKWTTVTVLTIGLLVTALVPMHASAQTRYPLTCRGGYGASLDIIGYGNPPPIIWDPSGPIARTLSPTYTVHVNFQHANHSSATWLETPGSCAFADRGMRADEPKMICIDNVKMDVLLYHPVEDRVSTMRPWVPLLGVDVSAPEQVRWAIEGLEFENQVHTFMVYNDHKGCLRF